MNYIQGLDRKQTLLFPQTLDEYVTQENPVRFIDAYVEQLDMLALAFTHAQLAATGRSPYRPQDMLKLYLYGYLNKIRGTRPLEEETYRNVELMWLLGKLHPDFKTIADFRKNNTDAIKSVCKEFTLLCKQLKLFDGELVGIDGSKFEAVNHSGRSFTGKGLASEIAAAEQQVQAWLEELDQADQSTPEAPAGALAEKIAALQAEKEHLGRLREELDASGETGISLTDPDSRKMRTGHGGHDVCYNVQIAVDSKHKLILAHQVSNEQNDLHQLLPMAEQAKAVLGVESLEVTADKGYYNEQHIQACESRQIACYIPAPAYDGGQTSGIFSEDEFTYLPGRDAYRCPAGQLLGYKSTVEKAGKRTRIYESPACQRCPLRSQCTKAKKGNRRIYRWIHKGVIEAVNARNKAHPEKMKRRGQLVEHPFGTLKRAMQQGYFLTRGLEQVRGEMSLSILAYNMKRVLHIVPLKELMEAVAAMSQLTDRFQPRFWLDYFSKQPIFFRLVFPAP